jgi:hypothetical protein
VRSSSCSRCRPVARSRRAGYVRGSLRRLSLTLLQSGTLAQTPRSKLRPSPQIRVIESAAEGSSEEYADSGESSHQPETMSELYSRMEFELDRRLDEAERVRVGFTVPSIEVAPSAPRISEEVELELALQAQ